MAYAPCRNPNCSSQGRAHPNCHCYDGGKRPLPTGTEAPGVTAHMADGGEMQGCNNPHDPKCQYHIPQDSSEVFHNAVAHHGLSNLIKQTSSTDLDKIGKNPYRAFDHYIEASRKGAKKYDKTLKSTFNKEHHELSANPEHLHKQLDEFNQNPDSALEIGSAVGHISPQHVIDMGATVGIANNYLNSIKPVAVSNGPLNDPLPVSPIQKHNYDRQVHIVEQPLSVVERVKNGSLLPQDMQTLTTVYPKLYEKLKNSVMEQVINEKTDNKTIPYQTRLSLGLFLGQPMDASQSQSIMMAAARANAPKQPPQPQGKSPKKPTASAVKQQDKVTDLMETNTQSSDAKKD